MEEGNQLHDVKELIVHNTTNFSKRSRLRECLRKIKREFCRPTECSTRKHSSAQCFHHLRRWKNPQQSYRLLGSVPSLHEEVILVSQKRGGEEREYSNDLQKTAYVENLKRVGPDQYRMRSMMLKWFFKYKSRDQTEEKRTFEGEQENSENDSSTSVPVSLESESILKNDKNDVEKFTILDSEKYDSGHDCVFQNVQNEQANHRIVGDLISRIDDFLSETL